MARPQKIGLDYFPLDVNYYRDIKVRKLMRSNGGGKALSVYTVLLCNIYENGYYMLWDDDVPFMLSEILGFEESTIHECIKYCLSVGLLDKEMFTQHKILTSRSIQSRYFAAVKRRVKSLESYPYHYPDLCTENEFLHTETPLSDSETPLSDAKSTQKKSKVKEIVKSSFHSDLPLSSSTTATTSRMREDSGYNKNKGENPTAESQLSRAETPLMYSETREGSSPINVAAAVQILKKSNRWLLQMQRRHGAAVNSIILWLDAFTVECECRGTSVHTDMTDVMRHFNDWLTKQLKTQTPKKNTSEYYHQVWLRCQAELSLENDDESAIRDFFQIKFKKYDAEKHDLYLSVADEPTANKLEAAYGRILPKVLFKRFGRIRLIWNFRNVPENGV